MAAKRTRTPFSTRDSAQCTAVMRSTNGFRPSGQKFTLECLFGLNPGEAHRDAVASGGATTSAVESLVNASLHINCVGTQCVFSRVMYCCMLLTEMTVLLSSTDGFSATNESYSDLQSVTWSILSGVVILNEGVRCKSSDNIKLQKLERSSEESAALASAARVLLQIRPERLDFQSIRQAWVATSVA